MGSMVLVGVGLGVGVVVSVFDEETVVVGDTGMKELAMSWARWVHGNELSSLATGIIVPTLSTNARVIPSAACMWGG